MTVPMSGDPWNDPDPNAFGDPSKTCPHCGQTHPMGHCSDPTAEQLADAITAAVCHWDASPTVRRRELLELLARSTRAGAERMRERIAAGLDRGADMARQAGAFDRAQHIAAVATWVRALLLP